MESNLKKLPRHQPRRLPHARSLDSNVESAPQVFLRTFVRALILNTAAYQEAVRKQRKAQALAQNRIPPPQPVAPPESLPEQPHVPGYTSINTGYTPQTQQQAPTPHFIQPHPAQIHPLTQNNPRTLPFRQLPPRPGMPPTTPTQQAITFTTQAIQQFLNDPQVQSVECPGPGKPIVIVKQNRPQVTTTTLDNAGIQAFLQEVAQKTKIPVGEGLYKAILGPYIITAVLSEIIGNRCIIQRR